MGTSGYAFSVCVCVCVSVCVSPSPFLRFLLPASFPFLSHLSPLPSPDFNPSSFSFPRRVLLVIPLAIVIIIPIGTVAGTLTNLEASRAEPRRAESS